MPSPTSSASVASVSAGISRSCASPTVTTTEPAMQRWPGRAERGADDAVDGLVDHGVGHDDHVVLGPAERLDALAGLRGALVDELGDGRGADEGDRVDPRVVEDPLDDLAAAVDEVDHAVRQPEPVDDLERDLLRERHLLGRLEDERVAAPDGEREEPVRHHRREVEGDDRGAHADGLADGLGVHVARDVLEHAALHRRRDRARALDHLDHPRHLGARVDERLAHLRGDRAREVLAARA